MSTYRGFSTSNARKKTRLTDFDLVKQDLINHFYIKKGEKLHNPEFGTDIWYLLFEPMTEALKDQIYNDVANVIDYDPRVNAEEIIISEFDRGIRVEIELTYRNTNETSRLSLEFDADQRSVSVL